MGHMWQSKGGGSMTGINEITAAISTLGFPIFCCVYMAWYINKQDTKNTDAQVKLTDIIENNTKVMTQLVDKLSEFEDRMERLRELDGGGGFGHK